MRALTERQRDLLRHVARYRVTTVEAVDRLLYLEKAGKSSPVAALNLLLAMQEKAAIPSDAASPPATTPGPSESSAPGGASDRPTPIANPARKL